VNHVERDVLATIVLWLLAVVLAAVLSHAHASNMREAYYAATCYPQCIGATCDRYDNDHRERELRRQLQELRNQWLHRGDDPARPY
jgi:hypothetical protein